MFHDCFKFLRKGLCYLSIKYCMKSYLKIIGKLFRQLHHVDFVVYFEDIFEVHFVINFFIL
jgi:hypothetical protein